ncbi:Lysosomal alpha-mannosidase [Armadillidium nasatum]|uniref:Lysosomal alpha-mannosidase n=1 Tax=Armadillidium nasatum TaxID=96803 RepID=A0A5N5T220_9CRUS|nr:Lysosomal alpha-mannosidase [Armadillidium nasatum]
MRNVSETFNFSQIRECSSEKWIESELNALHNENIKWPTKTDDFFPYSSDPHAFWTGYFTSRPTLKGLIRKCNNLLQAIKQVSAILRLNRGEELERLAEAMAVAQHHDAVTGTAKQHVTDDYYKRLFIGMLGTNELLSEGFRKMTQSSNSVPKCTEYVYCPLLNISSCPFTEDQQSFVVNIYNPVSRVSQDWMWYAGMAGNNTESIYRASGAYIFRPDGSIKKFSDVAKITAIYDDSLVAEIHQQWTTWVSQVLRIYKDKNYVESDWLVGPIPIEDGIGKEIVNQFHFKNLKTNQTFYTDANGREMQKRVKDFRPTWKLNSTEPVSQNYYPVTSRIIISSSDGKTKAAIMNDRAQVSCKC